MGGEDRAQEAKEISRTQQRHKSESAVSSCISTQLYGVNRNFIIFHKKVIRIKTRSSIKISFGIKIFYNNVIRIKKDVVLIKVLLF